MTEFKAGDKVKIVKNSTGSDNVVGEIGVVTHTSHGEYFVEVVEGRTGCYHVYSDLELVKEKPKFYNEVVTRKVVLNRYYVTTDLPSGGKFVTYGGSECVGSVGDIWIKNGDIPTIIAHLQQWYDAVQLEKDNKK